MSSAKGLADGYSPYEVGTGRRRRRGGRAHHGPRHRSLFFGNYTGRTSRPTSPVTKDLDLHQPRRHRTSR